MEEQNPISQNKKVNPIVIAGLVLLVCLAVIPVVLSGKKTAVSSSNQVEAANNSAPGGPVKEFTVDGSNFAFDPKTITVNKGDTVKIIFKDDDGSHNLIVDQYNVSTNVIGGGSQDTIQFVADKTGSFEYYCSVANHRNLGMTGTLIVK